MVMVRRHRPVSLLEDAVRSGTVIAMLEDGSPRDRRFVNDDWRLGGYSQAGRVSAGGDDKDVLIVGNDG